MGHLLYFNAQISFMRETKNGGTKEEKTYFLIRGVNVSDVEKQIYEKLEEEEGYEDFRVISVSESKISKILDYDEDENYINAQIVFEIQKENGDIKESKDYCLIRSSMSDAENILHEDLKGHPQDYRISAISESKITKVIDNHNEVGD